MQNKKIAFIGTGNMAKAIIGGLIAESYAAQDIIASGPRADNMQQIAQQYGIHTTTDNLVAARDAKILVLGVKPQILKGVCENLRASLTHKPLVISLAAGINTHSLSQWLGHDIPIIRCMPNTPAQVRVGASGLFANAQVNDAHKSLAQAILGAVGIVQWFDDEALINSVTAVSGSGPAYFFLMMEAMIQAGEHLGLSREAATELTLQTALGAAILAKQSDVDVVELRRRVTSPKGTTEQAILSFEQDKIREIFQRAMQACENRAVELSEQLGK